MHHLCSIPNHHCFLITITTRKLANLPATEALHKLTIRQHTQLAHHHPSKQPPLSYTTMANNYQPMSLVANVLARIPEFRLGMITEINEQAQLIFILSHDGRNVVAANFEYFGFPRLARHYYEDPVKLVSYIEAGVRGEEAVDVQIYKPRATGAS